MMMIIMLPRIGLKDIFKESAGQRERNLGRKTAYKEKLFSLDAKEAEKSDVFLKGSVMEYTAFHLYVTSSDIAEVVSDQKW